MIQPETDIEKPGVNAVDHPCEMRVELPMEEDEQKPKVVKCRILALEQCADCSMWICGTEELEHCIVCVRCGDKFCPEHYHTHRLANNCIKAVA